MMVLYSDLQIKAFRAEVLQNRMQIMQLSTLALAVSSGMIEGCTWLAVGRTVCFVASDVLLCSRPLLDLLALGTRGIHLPMHQV
jgi:hypothetical protein